MHLASLLRQKILKKTSCLSSVIGLSQWETYTSLCSKLSMAHSHIWSCLHTTYSTSQILSTTRHPINKGMTPLNQTTASILLWLNKGWNYVMSQSWMFHRHNPPPPIIWTQYKWPRLVLVLKASYSYYIPETCTQWHQPTSAVTQSPFI